MLRRDCEPLYNILSNLIMSVLEEIKIAFIGPGVMAEAMISGLIRNNIVEAGALHASGPRLERVEQLQARYGLHPFTDKTAAARRADVVVLSVKPQMLDRVLEELRGSILPGALVLSIVAGAPIKKISQGLDHSIIIRSMPNTPAQIGEGITVWTASTSVTDGQREIASQILGALGESIYVKEESYLDMATALSGTGPAYVFLFMEAMVDAGVHLGFPRRIAQQLVAQTVRGSVDYFEKRDDPVHLARLRNQVTSPGGTSAEALYYLEKAGFRTAISRAIWAAFERSRELGEGAESHRPDSN
jgi:pyrroline-5-carboxylate reductase